MLGRWPEPCLNSQCLGDLKKKFFFEDLSNEIMRRMKDPIPRKVKRKTCLGELSAFWERKE